MAQMQELLEEAAPIDRVNMRVMHVFVMEENEAPKYLFHE